MWCEFQGAMWKKLRKEDGSALSMKVLPKINRMSLSWCELLKCHQSCGLVWFYSNLHLLEGAACFSEPFPRLQASAVFVCVYRRTTWRQSAGLKGRQQISTNIMFASTVLASWLLPTHGCHGQCSRFSYRQHIFSLSGWSIELVLAC